MARPTSIGAIETAGTMPVSSLAPTSSPGSVTTTGQQILIVEDDPATQATIDLLLRHYDYVPTQAPTLTEARRHLASADPDVILLDLNLPDGNGVDLLEHVRSTGRRARVIVLTGGSAPEHLRRLRSLRPDRLFVKPMNFLELLGGIRSELADAANGVAGQAAVESPVV